MADDRWRGVADALPEALRLAERARELLDRELPEELVPFNPGDRIISGLRAASVTGRIWIGPKDEAIGLVVWEPGVPAGRRVFVHLDDGYRNAAALDHLVQLLQGEPNETPVIAVGDPVPGFPPGVVESVLAARGFVRLLRVDFVDPGGPLPAATQVEGLRTVDATNDAQALARLFWEAYDDNPGDRALFRHHPDAREDARYSVDQLLHGGVGQFWHDASFAVPDPKEPGRLLAATIVNEFGGPLLAEVAVAPDARRRGYARRLILESTGAVRSRTAVPLRLVVTLRNRRAYRLYRSLGWRRIEATLGGPWVHPGALGLERLDPPFDGPAV
jgi:GNAT superfamily N-acetyltransferase